MIYNINSIVRRPIKIILYQISLNQMIELNR